MLDASGTLTSADVLDATVDSVNRTIAVRVADASAQPLALLVKEPWVRRVAVWPAFSGATYSLAEFSGASWYRVAVPDPARGLSFHISDFRLAPGRPLYSAGSPGSVLLERPMLVTLVEVPRIETDVVERWNENGTWREGVPRPVRRLGLSFEDTDTGGQTVVVHRTWLGQYGLTNPHFQYADGTSIANKSDEHAFYLFPSHFSILYVFTNDESFTKEGDQAFSDVHWDSGNRNLYVYADRRDPTGTNERMRSPAPVTYDQTTSFTVRATWTITQKGHWQYAVPLFFMGASNTRVDMANSVYVHYSSRDSNPNHQWYTPWYYLRYQDSTGTLRVNQLIDAPANTQYEFMFAYDAYARTMMLAMYHADGSEVGQVTYVLGTGETFSLGKVGAGAWGISGTEEARTIAATDDILLDASFARNGDFEVDGDGNNVPDYWQKWIWSKGNVYRSSVRARFGTWSVRIADSSDTKDYGLQTDRMSAAAGQSFVGSAWVYASSGGNAICLEFWNAMSSGSRLGVACRNTVTTGVWEYLDITGLSPTGTVAVDLLLYSSSGNRGTGYFDGGELRSTRSFWAMEIHTNNLPTPEHWDVALDYVTDLGIPVVRIDFVWAHVEPEPEQDRINWDHIAYWDAVIPRIRARGLGIVAILAGPEHWPDWANVLLSDDDYETLFPRWREFAAFIASRYGSDIDYYQLLNEENHPTHGSALAHTHEEEVRAFYEAYQGLLQGTGLTAAAHKSGFKTIANLWADLGGGDWNTIFRDILNDAWGRDSIDIVAIDHYPGTWCCGSNYRDWAVLDTLGQIARDYGKEMAVMETGFSTYRWPDHDQDDQETWVNSALDEVLLKRDTHNRDYPLNFFLLVSWYEHVDACSSCGAWVENHFGILTSSAPWGIKLAYDDLRYQVSRWM